MNKTRFLQKAVRHIDNAGQIRQFLESHPEAQRDINEKDEHGDTLLHFASRIHNMDVMAVLLEFGADPEAVNEHGRRPIHEVIDSLACVQFLVEKCHVDVNAMKRGDWTPVMIAALKGNLEIVKFLTASGALLNRHTRDGRTALYLAVQEGHVELSKYLTDQYPAAITQATNSGRFPTQAAAALHNDHEAAIDITHYLLSHAIIPLPKLLGHRDNSGRNMLLDSAVSQNLPLLQFLLDQGADANDADSLGRNMIHHAAMMGHLNVLQMLNTLEGLNWNAPDAWDYWTPLMHAARQGHFDIVKYLMESIQVDPTSKDKQGRTAQALALLWHHDAIAAYLPSSS